MASNKGEVNREGPAGGSRVGVLDTRIGLSREPLGGVEGGREYAGGDSGGVRKRVVLLEEAEDEKDEVAEDGFGVANRR